MKIAVIAILIVALAILGFIPAPGTSLRMGKQLLAEWLIILFVALFFVKNVWIKLFLIWVLVRAAMGWNKYSFLTEHTIFLYILFYQTMMNKIERKHLVYLLNGLCLIALFQSLLMILQYSGIWIGIIPLPETNFDPGGYLYKFDPLNNWKQLVYFTKPFCDKAPIFGLMSHCNIAAASLAICLPAFFRRKWCWTIPIVLVGLFLSKSLGGIIPAVIVLWCFLLSRPGKWGWYVSIFVLLLAGSYLWFFENLPSLASGTGRLAVWKEIVTKMIPKRWVIGWGVGQYQIAFPAIHEFLNGGDPYVKNRMVQAHNDYIQLWFNKGMVGFTFAMSFIGSLFIKGIRAKSEIAKIAVLGLLAVCLNAGVNFLFQVTVGVIFLVYALILEKEGENLWHGVKKRFLLFLQLRLIRPLLRSFRAYGAR